MSPHARNMNPDKESNELFRVIFDYPATQWQKPRRRIHGPYQTLAAARGVKTSWTPRTYGKNPTPLPPRPTDPVITIEKTSVVWQVVE